jgi:ABC-2 type transporter
MSTTWCRCFVGIVEREFLRFLRQRSRFFASLVRPLVWLVLFAGGFHSVLGFSRIPPYQTYILYEEYIVPGLVGLILLFNGMQAALSMVFDREMGSMKVLLVSPLPRWYLLSCRLVAASSWRSRRSMPSSPARGCGASGRRRTAIFTPHPPLRWPGFCSGRSACWFPRLSSSSRISPA